jgi:hypothetical protein
MESIPFVNTTIYTPGAFSSTDNSTSPTGGPDMNTQLVGSAVLPVYLLSADNTAAGMGAGKPIGGLKTLRIEVWGTGTFSVQILASMNSGVARTIPVWDNVNRTFVEDNTITAAGFYDIDVQGYLMVYANVLEISGGTVNASGGFLV